MNPDQAAAERQRGVEIATKLAELGFDITKPEGKELAKMLAEKPESVAIVQTAIELYKNEVATYTKEVADAGNGAKAEVIQEQLKAAEASGNKEKASKLKTLLIILAAIALALTAVVVAGPPLAAVGAVGALAAGVSKA